MRSDALVTSLATSSVFEANRARGAVRFDVHARDGVTRRRDGSGRRRRRRERSSHQGEGPERQQRLQAVDLGAHGL